MDRMRIVARRNRDGVTLGVEGEGRNLGAAWINAADKASEALCPESPTPGYEWTCVSATEVTP